MIEKFTPEELEIIMKEIKELPKDKAKRDWCCDSVKLLTDSYKNTNVSGAPHPYELTKTVFSLVDAFMGNFTKATNNGKKYKGKYTRNVYINKNMAYEYRQCVNEIVKSLAKHSREFKEEENEVRTEA